MEFKVIVLAVCLIGSVSCYSAGAPESECSTMTPRHKVEAQRSAFPYTINLSKRQVRAGETVEVTVKGKTADDVIKGFIVQARVGDTPVGVWDASPSAAYAQLVNCGNSKSVCISQCQSFSLSLTFVSIFLFSAVISHTQKD